MIERRSNRRARNGRKTPKNVLFVFQNCTFRFADYRTEIFADDRLMLEVDAQERILAMGWIFPD